MLMRKLQIVCELSLYPRSYNETINMVSASFSKQLGMFRLHDTGITVEEQYGYILWFYYTYFFTFENWSQFASIVWEMTAMPFSL